MKRPVFPRRAARTAILAALKEDRVQNDKTSLYSLPSGIRAQAILLTRQAGTVSGLPLVAEIFKKLNRNTKVRLMVRDGDRIRQNQVLAQIQGPALSLMQGERVVLNFVARMSGIATLTQTYVKACGKKSRVFDTRKTTPGLRSLEKYAVVCGGGWNHRFDLSDGILIKDNHLAMSANVELAVARVRKRARRQFIEVEVTSMAEAREALGAGADMLLLDNMNPRQIRAILKFLRGRALVEVSGGVTLKTIRSYADCRPDRISVGALTHSAVSMDLSMKMKKL